MKEFGESSEQGMSDTETNQQEPVEESRKKSGDQTSPSWALRVKPEDQKRFKELSSNLGIKNYGDFLHMLLTEYEMSHIRDVIPGISILTENLRKHIDGIESLFTQTVETLMENANMEKKETRDKISDLEQEVISLNEKLKKEEDARKIEKTDYEKKIVALEKKASDAEDQLQPLKELAKDRANSVLDAKTHMEETKKENEKLKQDIESANKEANEATKKAEELRKKLEAIELREELNKSEILSLKESREKLENELKNERERYERLAVSIVKGKQDSFRQEFSVNRQEIEQKEKEVQTEELMTR